MMMDLGELTDELSGNFIEEYVSGSPKNYAFRANTGKETCKVREVIMQRSMEWSIPKG